MYVYAEMGKIMYDNLQDHDPITENSDLQDQSRHQFSRVMVVYVPPLPSVIFKLHFLSYAVVKILKNFSVDHKTVKYAAGTKYN